MLPKSHLQTTTHRSDFGEEWIGLRYGDTELTNCVSAADWHTQPAAPWACWHCGLAWCCAHRLARIVRTEDQLLWMTPYFSTYECKAFSEIRRDELFDAALLIDRADWESTIKTLPSLPAFESFDLITNHDICYLWLQERPAHAVQNEWDTVSQHIRHHCIASHPFDLQDAIQIIETHLHQLCSPPKGLVGTFQKIEGDPDAYNTLYFDGKGTPEFIAFLSIFPHFLVISGRYYFAEIEQPANTPLHTEPRAARF